MNGKPNNWTGMETEESSVCVCVGQRQVPLTDRVKRPGQTSGRCVCAFVNEFFFFSFCLFGCTQKVYLFLILTSDEERNERKRNDASSGLESKALGFFFSSSSFLLTKLSKRTTPFDLPPTHTYERERETSAIARESRSLRNARKPPPAALPPPLPIGVALIISHSLFYLDRRLLSLSLLSFSYYNLPVFSWLGPLL